jgi:hypothetical protein
MDSIRFRGIKLPPAHTAVAELQEWFLLPLREGKANPPYFSMETAFLPDSQCL